MVLNPRLRRRPDAPARRAAGFAASLFVLALSVASITGCTYQLRGRVVEAGYESVQLLAPDDAAIEGGAPVVGARLVLTRDPGSLSREDATSAVAANNGWFTLRLNDFGSGWMEEQWGVRVSRTGFGTVDELVELPFDPSKYVLLITMARGPAQQTPEAPRGAELMDDATRYWQSPGGR